MFKQCLLLVFACSLLGGCSRFERNAQCRKLAASVNPELDAIEHVTRQRKRDAQGYDEIARRYRGLSEQVKALRFADAELAKAVSEYRKIFDEAAVLTRSLSDGLRSRDEAVSNRAQLELGHLTQRERLHVMQLMLICSR